MKIEKQILFEFNLYKGLKKQISFISCKILGRSTPVDYIGRRFTLIFTDLTFIKNINQIYI